MVLLVDMGNTRLNMAGWEEGKPVFSAETPTDRGWTAGSCAAALAKVLAPFGVGRWEGCALSSVVPALTDAVRQALFSVTGKEPVVLGTSNISFKVLTKDPVGADMLAGAEGALARVPMPAIVADLGTATTFCAQNKAGDVLGVAIAPGVALGLDALVDRASHLRSIAFEPPGPAIGTTTAESMQSGVIYGAACLVDGMFRRMAAEMDAAEGAPSLILTGGLAGLVAPYCETKPTLAPDLLLEGLYRCYLRAKDGDRGGGQ